MPDTGVQGRWRLGSLYPAGRWQGWVMKTLIRIWVAAGLAESRVSTDASWRIGEFVEAADLDAATAVALIGSSGSSVKAVLRLSDREGRTVAFIKYAETGLAQRRLAAERNALDELPVGVGPKVLEYGPLLEGVGLCMSAFQGHHMRSGANPPAGLVDILRTLNLGESFAAHEHPWLQSIALNPFVDVTPWVAALSGRRWDAVYMHGDLAPWNVLITDDGTIRLVDWEHAQRMGFPLVDLAYWVLQVGCLVHRSEPSRAFRKAVRQIVDAAGRSIEPSEARSIVRLAAVLAYAHADEDGHAASSRAQLWRRAVWESDIQ